MHRLNPHGGPGPGPPPAPAPPGRPAPPRDTDQSLITPDMSGMSGHLVSKAKPARPRGVRPGAPEAQVSLDGHALGCGGLGRRGAGEAAAAGDDLDLGGAAGS